LPAGVGAKLIATPDSGETDPIGAIPTIVRGTLTVAADSATHADHKISINPGGAAIVFNQQRLDLNQGDNAFDWPIAGQADPATC